VSATYRLRDGRVLTIGLMDERDAEEVVAYIDRVGGETEFLTFGPGEYDLTVAQEEEFLRRLQGGRFNFLLKGVLDGQIVSTASIHRQNRPRLRHVGELGISVLEPYWGLGIGRTMIQATLRAARERGVRKVNLKVREDNARAIALYESLGFALEGRSERAYLIRGRFHAERLMGLALD
jgi:RimJ/RimL family protein N-acetyltransferase